MVRDDAAGIVRALAKMMEERAEVRKRESGRGKLTYKEERRMYVWRRRKTVELLGKCWKWGEVAELMREGEGKAAAEGVWKVDSNDPRTREEEVEIIKQVSFSLPFICLRRNYQERRTDPPKSVHPSFFPLAFPIRPRSVSSSPTSSNTSNLSQSTLPSIKSPPSTTASSYLPLPSSLSALSTILHEECNSSSINLSLSCNGLRRGGTLSSLLP
jgi:hypothetical protein